MFPMFKFYLLSKLGKMQISSFTCLTFAYKTSKHSCNLRFNNEVTDITSANDILKTNLFKAEDNCYTSVHSDVILWQIKNVPFSTHKVVRQLREP